MPFCLFTQSEPIDRSRHIASGDLRQLYFLLHDELSPSPSGTERQAVWFDEEIRIAKLFKNVFLIFRKEINEYQ